VAWLSKPWSWELTTSDGLDLGKPSFDSRTTFYYGFHLKHARDYGSKNSGAGQRASARFS